MLGALTLRAAAQEDDEARQVAASVQSFYNQTKGVEARFRQSYYYKLYDRRENSSGTVTFLKPGCMRWRYGEPNGKVITSNGQELWVFEPGDEGERAQCLRQPISENQLPQAFSFLTGTGRLEEDFTFRLLDSQRQRYPAGYVLELRPRVSTPHYDRILFYVPRRDERPSGIVQRVMIIDSSGNRNRFDFEDFQWNPRVTVGSFNYQPPSGVRCTVP